MRCTLVSLALLSLSQAAPFGSQSDPAPEQSLEFISHTLYVKTHGHFAPKLNPDPSGSSALSAAHGLTDDQDETGIKFPPDMSLKEMKTRVDQSPLMEVAPEKTYVSSLFAPQRLIL